MSSENLLLAMVWVLSGLFVAFIMHKADESKSENYKGNYWLKNSRHLEIIVFNIVLLAPLALIFGIAAMMDYVKKE
ncbi:MAG: hypothetical protein UR69_C0002G0147 [Candidatus Moranbacteria bacterium GW2011_GWE2_35_2-]|nr:MAG: hypothetical protein UR69_C0002G0147 [Candidatus Moranbacteria bacterium GW2011_GWE2_35_2-]KKQ22503.1 MAG: hypothetical protein US37_C0002G0128 [Candidatus Moranbacteria bacterium GW2011_GWF2_37_11]KKQ29572.1 MAG: hypothetical protein US44_C0001G0164 [Candidatus Moranbacteria bacterium GW2011_GWD1_37_17]KKQ30557.1 MAG: hypothetical protein US47_C0002G0147 [Candidatus Moranbacteria bacterium GW2011_GWE1_37_24]KKQ47251.1 MAG: hypothetical protein US66_C0015G0012 [Candidatus Moranbacteria 